MNEELLFDAVSQLPAGSARARFLADACAGAPDLQARLEALLEAHDHPDSFLEPPPAATILTDEVAERPGTTIGPYKLLEQIGEGGFGVVFMAEQTAPVRRKVALKVIKPGMDTRQVIARFEAERQALALMDHPNIAKVFDAGTTGGGGARSQESGVRGHETGSSLSPDSCLLTPSAGRPYFVMELVKGVPITDYCDQHQLAPKQRLELFITVCQAVQHAHQKGIIHRDIKPSNVLVAPHDDHPVVKVIDFGIAKATSGQLTDKTLFTGYAQLIGTPLYMSPEQAAMNAVDVDTRSDIYSLGVLLYELLTGTTPFDKSRMQEAAFDEVRRIIREEEPPRPSARISTLRNAETAPAARRQARGRQRGPTVLGELDWIVMKALEKDRNRRYESAGALARDIERHLRNEPVQACPPSNWYRFRKFARRNRREVLVAGAAAVVAVVGVAGLGVSRALIGRALRSETRAKQDLRTEVYFQRITVAHRELSIDNLAATLRALQDCPDDLRGWEWHYLMRLCKVEPLVLRDSTEVFGVAFSPDGERIASAGKDGKVKIWNSTGNVIKEIPAHEIAACSVAFHPDGGYLASASNDRLVKVWELATGQEVFQGPCDALRPFGGAGYTVAFSPDGRHLTAGSEQMVRVWDWKRNRPEAPEHIFPGPEYHSIPVVFSHDGRLATGGSWQDGLNLWDPETGEHLRSLPAPRYPVSALAFSGDGGLLASANLGRRVGLWDTTTGQLLEDLPHSGDVLGVAFSSDGRRLVSTGLDKTVHIWDATTGREILGLRGHADACSCVAFSPDGWRLASASNDRTIRVWDATPLRGDEGQETLTFTHDNVVRSVAVSPDGRSIVSGGGTPVKVWDATTGRESFGFTGHSLVVFSATWHADGRLIATAGTDGREHAVKVWDASDGRVDVTIAVGQGASAGPFQAVAFSPDGRYLVTGKLDGVVQVWDAKTGQKVQVLDARTGQEFGNTFATHNREIRALVFSRDGKHLVSASGDGEVKLWDGTRLNEKQEPRRTLRARVPGFSVNVAFSPDGRRLATGGKENTVIIWDAQTGDEIRTLRGQHSGEVYTLAFSPDDDGRWIATAGEDSAVKLWDSHTGSFVRNFRGHTGLVVSLAFSPDGRRLYSGSEDKTVKVWDMTQLSD